MVKYLDNKYRIEKRIILLLLFVISSEQLICSVHNNPFDYLEISIQLTQNVNHNTFHEFYESKNGGKASFNTPFYWGNVQASFKLMPFIARRENNANFIILQPDIKWGKNIYLSDKITLFNSVGIGIDIFYFANKKFSSIDGILLSFTEKTESEIVLSFSSKISHSLNNNIYLNLEFSNDIIFTYKKINLVDMHIGMAYLITTPRWIKLILE